MEAMMDDDIDESDDMMEEDDKILNQDEIDSLLGFGDDEDDGDSDRGIKAILDRALMAYEKMPMLEIVFDRLVRVLSSSLRNFTSDNVDVSIESMASLRFEEYLNSIPLPAMICVHRAVEWNNFALLTLDSSLIYSTVEMLLGGRRSNRPIRVEGRPYTSIERDIIKKMIDIMLTDMSSAFDPLSPVTFEYDRIESNPRFATISRPNNAALLIRLRVDMEERGGVVEILFPHSTLEPIRDLLIQMFMGERFGNDKSWEKYFEKEVKRSDVPVEVVLDEKMVKFGETTNFKIGDTILLDSKPGDDILIRSGGIEIGTGKMGKMEENIAVKLNDAVNQEPFIK